MTVRTLATSTCSSYSIKPLSVPNYILEFERCIIIISVVQLYCNTLQGLINKCIITRISVMRLCTFDIVSLFKVDPEWLNDFFI